MIQILMALLVLVFAAAAVGLVLVARQLSMARATADLMVVQLAGIHLLGTRALADLDAKVAQVMAESADLVTSALGAFNPFGGLLKDAPPDDDPLTGATAGERPAIDRRHD